MVKKLPAVQETWVQSLVRKISHWVKISLTQWLPTSVFLSGEFHGQRGMVGYHLWDHKESDVTEG